MADLDQKVIETPQEFKQADETVPTENTPNEKKKFGWKDIIVCALILVTIATVAGAVLGAVNYLTYVDPDSVIKEQVAGVYGVSADLVVKDDALIVDAGTTSKVLAVYAIENVGYCYYTSGAKAKDGTIELLVYITNEGVIKDVAVYEQGETAGYFKKVETANKAKYVGIDLDDHSIYMVGAKSEFKEGDVAIEKLSQATYTSSGYHNAIAVAAYAYKHMAK